jgi:hypothetical protein
MYPSFKMKAFAFRILILKSRLYQYIQQCQNNKNEDKAVQHVDFPTSYPGSMEVLFVNVNVACIKITAVLSIHTALDKISLSLCGTMIAWALENSIQHHHGRISAFCG